MVQPEATTPILSQNDIVISSKENVDKPKMPKDNGEVSDYVTQQAPAGPPTGAKAITIQGAEKQLVEKLVEVERRQKAMEHQCLPCHAKGCDCIRDQSNVPCKDCHQNGTDEEKKACEDQVQTSTVK